MTTTPNSTEEVQAAEAAREYIGAIVCALFIDMTKDQKIAAVNDAQTILTAINETNKDKSNLETFACTMLMCESVIASFHKSLTEHIAIKPDQSKPQPSQQEPSQ